MARLPFVIFLAGALAVGGVLAATAPNYRAVPTLACLKGKKVVAYLAVNPRGVPGLLRTVGFAFAFEPTANPGRGELYFMRSPAYAVRAKAQYVADYQKQAHRKPEPWTATPRRNVVLFVDARLNAYERRTIDRCLAASVQ